MPSTTAAAPYGHVQDSSLNLLARTARQAMRKAGAGPIGLPPPQIRSLSITVAARRAGRDYGRLLLTPPPRQPTMPQTKATSARTSHSRLAGLLNGASPVFGSVGGSGGVGDGDGGAGVDVGSGPGGSVGRAVGVGVGRFCSFGVRDNDTSTSLQLTVAFVEATASG
jgi:hypothetical protein